MEGWPQAFYVAEDDLELLIPLLCTFHMLGCQVGMITPGFIGCLRLNSNKHSTNRAASSAHYNAFMEKRTCRKTRCCWFCGAR